MNYYNDREIIKNKGNSCNNINFLRYVDNISYEFSGLKIELTDVRDKHFKEISDLLNQIKESQAEKNLLSYDFYYTEKKEII